MKKLIWVFLVLFVVVSGYGLFLYFKPVAGTAGQEPVFRISAPDLFTAYENDLENAKSQYEGQIIEVEGEVLEVTVSDENVSGILLSGGSELTAVNCSMESGTKLSKDKVKTGMTIKVKGVCQGLMDSDLFADVILNRCVVE